MSNIPSVHTLHVSGVTVVRWELWSLMCLPRWCQITTEWPGSGITPLHPHWVDQRATPCYGCSAPVTLLWHTRIKIVRLAAIWKFFRSGHEKFQKTAFFAKNPPPGYFLMGKFFKDRTMSKLSSRGFRKCGTFWAYDLFNGSYCCSKSAQGSKSVFVPKNKRCQKKSHARNFFFFSKSSWEKFLNTI